MNRHILAALLLVLIGGAAGNWFRFASASPDRSADLSVIPLEIDGYHGREEFFSDNTYDVLNATSSTLKRYVGRDGSRLDLFVAYFESQRFGAGIHSPRHCLPAGGWRIREQEPFLLTFADGTSSPVNRMTIVIGNRVEVMIYWYATRSGIIRTELDLKLSVVRTALSLQPTDAALVRVTVPVEGRSVESATNEAIRFIRETGPYIEAALPF